MTYLRGLHWMCVLLELHRGCYVKWSLALDKYKFVLISINQGYLFELFLWLPANDKALSHI